MSRNQNNDSPRLDKTGLKQNPTCPEMSSNC
jgi:hypothetical protein